MEFGKSGSSKFLLSENMDLGNLGIPGIKRSLPPRPPIPLGSARGPGPPAQQGALAPRHEGPRAAFVEGFEWPYDWRGYDRTVATIISVKFVAP